MDSAMRMPPVPKRMATGSLGIFEPCSLTARCPNSAGWSVFRRCRDAGRICQYLQRSPVAEEFSAYPARPFFIPRNNAICEVNIQA